MSLCLFPKPNPKKVFNNKAFIILDHAKEIASQYGSNDINVKEGVRINGY